MENVKIKICGITKSEEIKILNEAGVDLAGFVFYEKSKRNIDPERAAKLKTELSPSIKSVAVTVSPDAALIRKIDALGFDIIQMHGDIDSEAIAAAKHPVWIALNEKTPDAAEHKIALTEEGLGDRAVKIRAYLFDAPDFGSGKTSDWESGRRIRTDKMFVLAGGLSSDNINEGIRIFEPDVVDVSSSVEGKSGKDRDKIFSFVNAVRKVRDDE